MATEQDATECSKCNRCFIHKTTLKEHQELSCGSRSVFTCPSCDKQFEDGWYLDQHLIRHQHVDGDQSERNFEDHKCANCSSSFRSSLTLATHQAYCCSTTRQLEDCVKAEEQLIETSDDEKLHIVEKCSRKKRNHTEKPRTSGKKVEASLKIVLKMTKMQQNTSARNQIFVEQLFQNIPETINDKSILVQNTLKLLFTTLKKDHEGMKQGELAFMYKTEKILVRVVKVLQVSDGVFRGVSYDITNNKMMFKKKTEILQLVDVICHGKFKFPTLKERKKDCNAYSRSLISFQLMPALVNAIFTQAPEVEELVGGDAMSSWYASYKGTTEKDEEGDEPSTITTNITNDEKSGTSNNGANNTIEKNETITTMIDTSNSGGNNITDHHAITSDDTSTTPTSNGNISNQTTDENITNTEAMVKITIANDDKEEKNTRVSENETAKQHGSDVRSVEVSKEGKVVEKKKLIEQKVDEKRPLVMKAYPCRVCRRCFVYEETRNLHEDNVCCNKSGSKKTKKLSCTLCNWQLSTSLDYDLHTVMKCSPRKTIIPQEQDSKAVNTCKYCQQQFVQDTTLATHLDYCCDMKLPSSKDCY